MRPFIGEGFKLSNGHGPTGVEVHRNGQLVNAGCDFAYSRNAHPLGGKVFQVPNAEWKRRRGLMTGNGAGTTEKLVEHDRSP